VPKQSLFASEGWCPPHGLLSIKSGAAQSNRVLGAIVAATAVPALAQVGVYAGPGGFGVELGAPGVYYAAPGYAYRYNEPGWNGYYAHPAWHGHRHYGHYQ
jgi:hypothetical protein